MASLIGNLTSRLRHLWSNQPVPVTQRSFRCQCERPVFFRNSQCLACHTELGYDVEQGWLIPLQPDSQVAGIWRKFGEGDDGPAYRRCGNYATASGCNWLLPQKLLNSADGVDDGFCVACKLNRVIPDQSIQDNRLLWGKVELAKRRLVSSLLALGLPVASKVSEDPARGLAFDFLRSLPPDPPVMTGHSNGVITINVDEADDARREQIRASMREPYRTLLGHFRHEVGHYYWDRLVLGTPWLDPYRALFGDERADYGGALRHHYLNGPPPDWAGRYVSSYASTHPWEDWAESWAHYLHMVDTLDTALSFGLDASDVELGSEPFSTRDLWQPEAKNAPEFLGFINSWVRITGVLNELSRSMGQQDFYPFALPRSAVAKLHFVHSVVREERSH
jgi:hypothetical protein